MSKLAEFREAERKLQEQLALLEKLKSDSSLKQELEFKDKLQALMDKYGMTLHNIIAILDPKAPVTVSAAPQRRARALKVYKNPNNGEVVETKGGNHKVLKAWKEQYGSETVESCCNAKPVFPTASCRCRRKPHWLLSLPSSPDQFCDFDSQALLIFCAARLFSTPGRFSSRHS
ncbi:transcriptional regulator [Pseudomonas aeruginosa PGPR2]|nr:transcriptional regulator [Pseudomonas aeruginosa PGPR2]